MSGKWVGWSARGTALLVGLYLYGVSMALMVRAGLGLDPWDVFHQGLSLRTGMSIGLASAVTGVVVLLAWIPLRNKPGVGTIANIVVIAISVDSTLAWLSAPSAMAARVAFLVGGVVLNAIATVLYVGAGLGPGPRDGLTTGLVHRTGRSVRLIRTAIEVLVVATGWLLGGSVGVGTVLYALGIGPLIQVVLRLVPRRLLAVSGWGSVLSTQRDTAPCPEPLGSPQDVAA
ncbi:MAG: YczE/YyaS/YitT family protein [Mycobacterium sp.]